MVRHNISFLHLDTCFEQAPTALWCGRVKEVCEGQKQIPFALELETGKWCAQALLSCFSSPLWLWMSFRNAQHAKLCLVGECRLYDSDKMIPYFEEKFPQKKLGRPDELPSVCVACPHINDALPFASQPFCKVAYSMAQRPSWVIAARHSCCAKQHRGFSRSTSLVPVCVLLQGAQGAFAARRGGSLFPTFMGFLQAQGGEQGEKEQELVAQLREVNDALGQSDGPFLVCGLAALGPALFSVSRQIGDEASAVYVYCAVHKEEKQAGLWR